MKANLRGSSNFSWNSDNFKINFLCLPLQGWKYVVVFFGILMTILWFKVLGLNILNAASLRHCKNVVYYDSLWTLCVVVLSISSIHRQKGLWTDAFWLMLPWQLHNSWIVLAFHLSFLSYDSPQPRIVKKKNLCPHPRCFKTPIIFCLLPKCQSIQSVSFLPTRQHELICSHKYLVSISLYKTLS